jgi:drug/metabolite transporter (DMT)-like permease
MLRVMSNFQIVCGIFALTISFFLMLSLLSWANLSFVYPATSLTYLFSLIGARYFLREHITPARLIGTVLVCLGAAVVAIG